MSARAIASRKLEIGAFLQSWSPLKEKLEELLACENASIESMTRNAISGAGVEELNKHIFQKKAIDRVFQLVDELKEDLHPDEVSSDEE